MTYVRDAYVVYTQERKMARDESEKELKATNEERVAGPESDRSETALRYTVICKQGNK